jgi:hypothetical protein
MKPHLHSNTPYPSSLLHFLPPVPKRQYDIGVEVKMLEPDYVGSNPDSLIVWIWILTYKATDGNSYFIKFP